MNFTKYTLLLILSSLLLSITPELSAKSHRRTYKKRSTRTSLALNVNMDARTRAYENAPVYYTAPAYYNSGYTTVMTQYPQPVYEQVTVVRPAPVQQVIVQQPTRPTFGISVSPFFSFWSN